jgi:hypothetical protein
LLVIDQEFRGHREPAIVLASAAVLNTTSASTGKGVRALTLKSFDPGTARPTNADEARDYRGVKPPTGSRPDMGRLLDRRLFGNRFWRESLELKSLDQFPNDRGDILRDNGARLGDRAVSVSDDISCPA